MKDSYGNRNMDPPRMARNVASHRTSTVLVRRMVSAQFSEIPRNPCKKFMWDSGYLPSIRGGSDVSLPRNHVWAVWYGTLTHTSTNILIISSGARDQTAVSVQYGTRTRGRTVRVVPGSTVPGGTFTSKYGRTVYLGQRSGNGLSADNPG